MIQSDSIRIAPWMLGLVAGIGEFKGAWCAAPDLLSALLRVATIESIGSVQIVDFAREHGRVTMADAICLTGGNRNTLKQHFRALVERGHLSPQGAGRGAWYELQ